MSGRGLSGNPMSQSGAYLETRIPGPKQLVGKISVPCFVVLFYFLFGATFQAEKRKG